MAQAGGDSGSESPIKDAEVGEPTADQLKEQGNIAVRNKKYEEAILNYTAAIKMTPKDPILHSNRSLAFLKLNQLYYANEDAEKTIELDPNWAKGYFRKAEVLYAAGQYDSALFSYAAALQRMPSDALILESAKKSAALSDREKMLDSRVPWVGAGVGIIVGVVIVILDQVVTKKPTIGHPALMVMLVMVVSGISLGCAKLYRMYVKDQRKGLLDPPLDLLEGFFDPTQQQQENSTDPDESGQKQRTRYTKAQARQRFKKGKS